MVVMTLIVHFLGFFLLFFFGRGGLPHAVAIRKVITVRVFASLVDIILDEYKNVLVTSSSESPESWSVRPFSLSGESVI